MATGPSRRLAIAIADYRVGNVHSVASLFSELGHRVGVSSAGGEIQNADVLVLPGVGSARTALTELRNRALDDAIRHRCELELPVIGICLGAQVLLGANEEAGGEEGIAVVSGSVRRLDSGGTNTGWRSLNVEQLGHLGLSRGLRSTSTFFFNHEFQVHLDAADVEVVESIAPSVPAVFVSGRTIGVQFHPEKSQASGKRFMKNVLEHVLR